MRFKKLSNSVEIKKYLKDLDVDGGGVNILANKAKHHLIYISNLHVGGANILKQDALSIGADLAVPRGTILAKTNSVDAILIASSRDIQKLIPKLKMQPFGLKEIASFLEDILSVKKPDSVEIMGVINANDDSFFSGSRFKDSDAILTIEKMIEQGADIIDIGGVSSRPNAEIVLADEELKRVTPILDTIKKEKLYQRVKFSIDSYTPVVIDKALNSGFTIVNDITGFKDDEVCKVCASYNATAVIMHMQGTPQTMQNNPTYSSVVEDIYDELKNSMQKAESFGVKDIILDVGIGFGKTLEHNIELIKNLEHFLTLGKPLLVGASRKSMIDKIYPSKVEDRLAGTLAIHLEAIRNGASILRVHDVYEHSQAISVHNSIFR
jgi:dihydropteroate synthase